MLIHEQLNKDTDIVPEEDPLVVLDSKSAMCMANIGKDTKHTRHISSIINFVRIGEKCNMHKIYWYQGGLQLADIGIKNVSEPDLTPMMKHIMVSPENRIQDSLQNQSSELLLQIELGTRINQFGCSKNMITVYLE